MTDIGTGMVTFDLRTSIIPFALLKICNHFKKMRPGEAIEILCIEPGIERDLECILPKAQCETVCTEASAVQPGVRVIRLRKVPGQTTADPTVRPFHCRGIQAYSMYEAPLRSSGTRWTRYLAQKSNYSINVSPNARLPVDINGISCDFEYPIR